MLTRFGVLSSTLILVFHYVICFMHMRFMVLYLNYQLNTWELSLLNVCKTPDSLGSAGMQYLFAMFFVLFC